MTELWHRYYAEIANKTVSQARKRMVELLRDPAGSATGGGGRVAYDLWCSEDGVTCKWESWDH